MKNNKLHKNIVNDILTIATNAQAGALRSVNTYLVIRNWLIGERIAKEVLTDRSSDYGKGLIANLAKQLSKYGKGFDKRTLYEYLKFYKLYPNIFPSLGSKPASNIKTDIVGASPQSLLPWSFYSILIKINDDMERKWYESETKSNGWSTRVLEHSIKTDTYHRILSHQSDSKVSNQLVSVNPQDYLKSLYIFDFVNIKNNKYKELDLEKSLVTNISKFILELGKGYLFKANQYHLRTEENDYYIDLVFYNTVLKCYLLIDLKVGKISHKDIGQMLIYLDLFDKQIKNKDDKSSIGMVLSSDTNSDLVKYLTLNTKNNIVSSKYLTYLPSKQQLIKELNKQKKLLSSINTHKLC